MFVDYRCNDISGFFSMIPVECFEKQHQGFRTPYRSVACDHDKILELLKDTHRLCDPQFPRVLYRKPLYINDKIANETFHKRRDTLVFRSSYVHMGQAEFYFHSFKVVFAPQNK